MVPGDVGQLQPLVSVPASGCPHDLSLTSEADPVPGDPGRGLALGHTLQRAVRPLEHHRQ